MTLHPFKSSISNNIQSKNNKNMFQIERIKKINRIKLEKTDLYQSINKIIINKDNILIKEKAIESIQYGLKCYLKENNILEECIISINNNSSKELLFINKIKRKTTKINIKDIDNINKSINKYCNKHIIKEINLNNYTNLSNKKQSNKIIHNECKDSLQKLLNNSIRLNMTNKEVEKYILCFKSNQDLIDIVYGICYLLDIQTEEENLR